MCSGTFRVLPARGVPTSLLSLAICAPITHAPMCRTRAMRGIDRRLKFSARSEKRRTICASMIAADAIRLSLTLSPNRARVARAVDAVDDARAASAMHCPRGCGGKGSRACARGQHIFFESSSCCESSGIAQPPSQPHAFPDASAARRPGLRLLRLSAATRNFRFDNATGCLTRGTKDATDEDFSRPRSALNAAPRSHTAARGVVRSHRRRRRHRRRYGVGLDCGLPRDPAARVPALA